MLRLRSRMLAVLSALILGLGGAGGCASDTTGNGDVINITDPAVLEAFLRGWFMPASAGASDGLNRLLVAVNSGSLDGVVIVPTGPNSVQAELSVDFDGNGSRESTIFGGMNGDIGTGAVISITGIDEPDTPSLEVAASTDVVETSPVTLLFDNMQGTLSADPPGSGNAAQVAVTDGAFSLDLVSGTPSGFFDVTVSGEGNVVGLSLSFESDGAGGWRLRVTGNGVNFTVP